MEEQPAIMVAHNMHAATCGQPPVIETGPGRYVSYFENEHGEQWIFVREGGAQTATVYGGDIGWEEPRNLSGPPQKRETYWTAAELVLNLPEALWLAACWAASQPLGK